MAQFLQTLALVSVIPLSIPLGAYAHMEMRWPYPFRSKFDPVITDPDYDNTFPLSSDGSNYPCKGYQNLATSQVSKVTYTPGQTYNMTLAGTATHMGGSCQISLSYDNGQSFKVIKSMIGGCPLKDDWDFTVPSDAPASDDAILSWTWFNLVGNREMYMNCARVAIAGQPVQRYRRYQRKRQNSLSELPDNFACNIGNGCTTIERREVVFPNPGPDIERNTDATVPDPGPGFTLTATPTGDAFSSVTVATTVTVVPYPVLNGSTTAANSTSTSYRTTGTGSSSTAYFNSTSLLTMSSRSTTRTTSLTSTTSTTTVATPAFFYPINGTNTTSTSTTTIHLSSSTSLTANTIATTTSSYFKPSSSFTATSYGNTSLSSSSSSLTSSPTGTISSSLSSPTSTATSSDLEGVFVLTTNSTTTASSSSTSLRLSTTPAALTTTSTTTFTLSPSSSSSITATVTSTSATMTTSTTSPTVASSMTSTTSSTATAMATATIVPALCTPGSFTCDSSTTFSQCVSDGSGSATYVVVGSVAPGTQCVDGTIARENAGSCTPNGSLQCNGENAFYICDQGGLIDMGSVAPGTVCRNGVIQAA